MQDGLICMNGGRCPGDDEPAVCMCPAEYTGKQCESKANFLSSCFVVLLIGLH